MCNTAPTLVARLTQTVAKWVESKERQKEQEDLLPLGKHCYLD